MKKGIYISLLLIYCLFMFSYFYFQNNIEDEGSLKLFFCRETNCSMVLTTLIENSKEVKCVFYDLDEPNIISSLDYNNVSTLIFDENFEKDNLQTHSSFKSVSSKGLMHHKFCTFDGKITLTGSWNPTDRCTYYNDNLILLIFSEKIAEIYGDEFEKLATGKKHNSNYKIKLSGIPIQICFSPEGNCEALISKTLLNANESIKFLAFTFTSNPLKDIILAKNQSENVFVEGVFEKTKITRYSAYNWFQNESLNVYLDKNSYTMHEKVFIVDDYISIIGSYNPTASANDKNEENLLVIEDKNISLLLNKEFQRIKAKALE